ncbi:Trimethylamine methyltransferase (MTTB) [Desulfocicer vacuolatum DSM 3385]|uniref:Trimethylamine methyltransferase (MTTB) n=1 Tax=Desulfocicer vacuolatum DSM 3385 TaxID=1121400 RepID=A0A1W2B9Y1_9BACT|nr:trimethylamine methyltransferase family protein [Desulfocicer vacuolatum]SMC69726.1 Trimethylamine methyltransferase (MTTB) [Desulfocicer vacuolatum DSM 3385]
MLESMLTVALEQYVIDDEIIGNCCKVLKGIEVDDEHLAMDVIKAVVFLGTTWSPPYHETHANGILPEQWGFRQKKS